MNKRPERSPDKAILKVQGLKKHFPVKRGFFQRVVRSIKAVDGVDFEIEKGKTLIVTRISGSRIEVREGQPEAKVEGET